MVYLSVTINNYVIMPTKPVPRKRNQEKRLVDNTLKVGLLHSRRRPKSPMLLALVAVFVAFGVFAVYKSFAATNIAVGSSTGAGVKVPSKGLYWGGTNHADFIDTPGCSSTNRGNGFDKLECKVQWAASSQGIAVPTSYHSSMEHYYTNCNSPIGADIITSAKVPGRKVLMINMTCGRNWAEMAAGPATVTANVQARTRELSALHFPIILTYHHEPEDETCGSTAYKGTPDEYRAASRRFIQIMRAQATTSAANTIATGWILMGYTYDKRGTEIFSGSCTGHTASDLMVRNPDNWYPGDDAIDWLLVDSYDNNGTRGFEQELTAPYAWSQQCSKNKPATNYSCTSAKFAKPIGFAETAVNGPTAHRASFFATMRTALPKFPNIKAYAFWSSGDATSGFDGHLDRQDDPAHTVIKEYAKLELDPYVHNLVFGPGSTPTPTPAITPTPVATAHGVNAVYFSDKNLTTSKIFRVDDNIAFDWASGSPDPLVHADTFSARWTGSLTAPKAGTYTISTVTDDGVRLWIDDVLKIDDWNDQGIARGNNSFKIDFQNTTTHHTIKMEYYQNLGLATAKLRWTPPGSATNEIPSANLYVK